MNEYNELIESFGHLNIKDKRDQVNEELRELFAVFHLLMIDKGIDEMPLLHSDMNDNNGTEHDFLNSTYSYLISIKENIGKYFEE